MTDNLYSEDSLWLSCAEFPDALRHACLRNLFGDAPASRMDAMVTGTGCILCVDDGANLAGPCFLVARPQGLMSNALGPPKEGGDIFRTSTCMGVTPVFAAKGSTRAGITGSETSWPKQPVRRV